MKKSYVISIICIMLVLVIALSGCKKKNDDTGKPGKDPIQSIDEQGEDKVDVEKVMKEFDKMIKNKDEPNKIVAFINENIKNLSQIEGDRMVLDLEIILEDSTSSLTDKLFEIDTKGELMTIGGTELFFPEGKVKDIQDEKLRDHVTKLLASNYKLINLEGSFYPIRDYEKMKQYNNYISDEIKDYIAIKALDSDKPVAIDAGLVISYDELADRILKTENYIQKYSEGKKYEEMLRSYRTKLDIYLNGLDNTPIADYESKKIYKDVVDSYEKTINTKDSVTAFVVSKYLDVIEENKYIIDKSVTDNVLSLVNEALSLLEASK
ncbi:hypothetical protein [Tissierella sp.]|uniref:hypothetical protein n=1 Tax=Tissierella sp. TaxID=41274 RepID=UPI00286444C9|nr:hypothetical protein [Tissierella sp.]MDR7855419.1 hypothetical protein [Tissierella sp.]